MAAATHYAWFDTPIGACAVPPYGVLGGRVDYNSADRDWSVGLWASNLLDKVYYTSYTGSLDTGFGLTAFQTGRPLEFGIELRRNF